MEDELYVSTLKQKTRGILDVYLNDPSLTAEDDALRSFAELGERQFYPKVRRAAAVQHTRAPPSPGVPPRRCAFVGLVPNTCSRSPFRLLPALPLRLAGSRCSARQIVTLTLMRAPRVDTPVELTLLTDLLLGLRKCKPAVMALGQFVEGMQAAVTHARVAGNAEAEEAVGKVVARVVKVREAPWHRVGAWRLRCQSLPDPHFVVAVPAPPGRRHPC